MLLIVDQSVSLTVELNEDEDKKKKNELLKKTL
jgi:hypothetical protein